MKTIQSLHLNRSITVALLALAFQSLQGCANLDDYGLNALAGNAPQIVRHVAQKDGTFYLEVLGNGFSAHEKLAPFWIAKAESACKGNPEKMDYRHGRRFPDGKLQDIRLESCISGGFCNRTHANFPLVFGTFTCKSSGGA